MRSYPRVRHIISELVLKNAATRILSKVLQPSSTAQFDTLFASRLSLDAPWLSPDNVSYQCAARGNTMPRASGHFDSLAVLSWSTPTLRPPHAKGRAARCSARWRWAFDRTAGRLCVCVCVCLSQEKQNHKILNLVEDKS